MIGTMTRDGGMDDWTAMMDIDLLQSMQRSNLEKLLKLTSLSPNVFGELPVTYLWRMHGEIFTNANVVAQPDKCKSTHAFIWSVITTLLRFAATGLVKSPPSRSEISCLHAASVIPCPDDFIDFLLAIYPEQARQCDYLGKYPLHAAVSYRIEEYDFMKDELKEYSRFFSLNQGSSFGCKRQNCRASKLSLLCKSYPAASYCFDKEGNLPLHCALHNCVRWSDGLENLIKANPDALSTKDGSLSLYPFQLAACVDRPDLNTIYEVVRSSIAMFRGWFSPKVNIKRKSQSSGDIQRKRRCA